MVGFVFNQPNIVATHVLAFMVFSLNPKSELKFILGYFGTTSATADD